MESEKELIIRVKRVKIVKEERFHESQSKGIVEKQRGEDWIGLEAREEEMKNRRDREFGNEKWGNQRRRGKEWW